VADFSRHVIEDLGPAVVISRRSSTEQKPGRLETARYWASEMSQENAEVVRDAYARFARGDFSAFEEVADQFEFVTSPELPDAGTYRGDAAIAWMRAWVDSFDDLTMEATEVIDAGDKVLVALFQRGRPHGSQAPVEGRWWQVVTLREGEIVRAETFPARAHALEAAGISE
jgi:ketosteroid isomerase-like protein